MISHIDCNAHQHVNMGGEGSLSNTGIKLKLLFPVNLQSCLSIGNET